MLQIITAQKNKVFHKVFFFSKCDHIRRKLRIWSHLMKNSLIENFIFLCSDSLDFINILIIFLPVKSMKKVLLQE